MSNTRRQMMTCLGQPFILISAEFMRARSQPCLQYGIAELDLKGGAPCILQVVPDTWMRSAEARDVPKERLRLRRQRRGRRGRRCLRRQRRGRRGRRRGPCHVLGLRDLRRIHMSYLIHMMYMITAIISIISIIAIMLINAIFNIYRIVSTARYTIHVGLFNVFLA